MAAEPSRSWTSSAMAARFVDGREMALGPGNKVNIRGLKLLEWDGERGRPRGAGYGVTGRGTREGG